MIYKLKVIIELIEKKPNDMYTSYQKLIDIFGENSIHLLDVVWFLIILGGFMYERGNW